MQVAQAAPTNPNSGINRYNTIRFTTATLIIAAAPALNLELLKIIAVFEPVIRLNKAARLKIFTTGMPAINTDGKRVKRNFTLSTTIRKRNPPST